MDPKKFLTFMSRIGLLRGGVKAYKGKNIGGDFAVSDISTFGKRKTTKKKPQQKTKSKHRLAQYAAWVFGVLFLLLGFLMLFDSFWSGLWLFLSGALITPVTSNLIAGKLGDKFTRKRKIIAIVILLLLFFVSTSGHVSVDGTDRSFSHDFEWTTDLAEQNFTQEKAVEMSFAGPFYTNDFEGYDEYTRAYTILRKQKVGEILKVVEEQAGLLEDFEKLVAKQRTAFAKYALTFGSFQPELKDDMLTLQDDSMQYAFANVAQLAFLKSTLNQINKEDYGPTKGYLMYSAYASAQNLTIAYVTEYERKQVMLSMLYNSLADTDRVAYHELNEELNQDMNRISGDAIEMISKLQFNARSLNYEEKALFTADYYFMKDVLAYMDEELPKLQAELDAYQGGKEGVDESLLIVMRSGLQGFTAHRDDVKRQLAQIDESDLLPPPDSDEAAYLMIPYAHAAWGNPLSYLSSKVASAANTTWDYASTGAGYAWDATKSAAVKVTDAAITTVKAAGQVSGVLIEATDASVKTLVDIGAAAYYGDYLKNPEILDGQIRGHWNRLYDNMQKGKAGKDQFQIAKGYMESAEQLGEYLATEGSKVVFGEGRISNGLGWMGKTTVNLFSGFAKDLYTVLDPSTSYNETLQSALGLAMGLIGGSGSLFDGAEKGLKEAVKQIFKFDSTAAKQGVKTLFAGGGKSSLTRVVTREGFEDAAEVYVRMSDDLFAQAGKILKAGKNGLLDGAEEAGLKALNNWYKKEGMNAVRSVLGHSLKDSPAGALWGYVKALAGNTADDSIKAFAKDTSREMGLSSTSFSERVQEQEGDSYAENIRDAIWATFGEGNVERTFDTFDPADASEGQGGDQNYEPPPAPPTPVEPEPVKPTPVRVEPERAQPEPEPEPEPAQAPAPTPSPNPIIKAAEEVVKDPTKPPCNPPYVKDGQGGCVAGSTYCAQYYTNMVYDQGQNLCVCKSGHVEESHGVCVEEKDEAAAEACVKSHSDRISQMLAHNAAQDPAGGSTFIKADLSVSSCADKYYSCSNAATATFNACGPGADGTYTHCITSRNQQNIACANAELSCALAHYKGQCGL